MQEKMTAKKSVPLWFGAAVSISEILTGLSFAPLGLFRGLLAIVIGHLIGGALLYLAGRIGAVSRRSAMDTVGISYGRLGALFFALLNILQLVGWTAVMIESGASVADALLPIGKTAFCLIIGALILLWVLLGIRSLGKINTVVMAALFLLTVVLAFSVFRGSLPPLSGETLSFGAAIELSVAMPLSWLALISDYTKDSDKGRLVPLVSSLSYTLVSIFMYVIGMGLALYGGGDLVAALRGLGFAAVGLSVILLSTVTTTFLDVYSAAVSFETIIRRVPVRIAGAVVTVLGTVLALFAPLSRLESFLYLIGSVFAPMIAILLCDFFLLKKDFSQKQLSLPNAILWLLGFFLYRGLMRLDLFMGSTVPCIIILVIARYLLEKVNETLRKEKKK